MLKRPQSDQISLKLLGTAGILLQTPYTNPEEQPRNHMYLSNQMSLGSVSERGEGGRQKEEVIPGDPSLV